MSILTTLISYYIFASLQWNFKTYPSSVSIGDEVHATIWVNDVTEGTIGYFFNVTNPEVVLKNKKIIAKKNGYKIDYTYAVFSTQPVEIKGIGFRWIPKNGKEKIYTLPAVKIFIKLVTKPGDKPKPPSSYLPVLVFNWDFIILSLLLLLLVGGILAGRAYFKRGKKEVTEEKPSEPPEIIAERRLNELLSSSVYQNKEWRLFFLSLTEIVRDYLAEAFRFSAYAETTFEIVTELKVKKITSSDLAMVRSFFERSDLIKFAKYVPSEEEVKELIENAKKIIKLGLKYHEI